MAQVDWAAPHLRYVGDSALLLDVGGAAGIAVGGLNREVNARAVAIAAAVRAAAVSGVRDVLSTFRSVVVHFDPLLTDVAAVVRVVQAASLTVPAAMMERTVEIPLRYGGDDGPDLPLVAEWSGLSTDEVIRRHTRPEYRVFMLGFLPGFPYLGEVDSSIAMPRRATPRLRVAAGAVGIAGVQTGIYPQDSPGGWQIIGRTDLDLFDAQRNEPALLAAGDRVRFVPAAARAGTAGRETSRREAPPAVDQATRSLTIVRPGLFTTIQDLGRWGHQHEGVSVCGAMDRESHRIANTAVGNPPAAATLEVTLAGPEIRVDGATTVAVAGADLTATLDGRELASATPTRCVSGAVLRFGRRRSGARAYVAFEGGIATPPALGSRSTHAVSRLGGVGGALRPGDRLPLAQGHGVGRAIRIADTGRRESPPVRLRVLPGPQLDQLPSGAFERLLTTTFTVSPNSDRMGYRLQSDVPMPGGGGDMLSDATFAGAVQVPPSGEAILLMADRQTTGGYPQAAVVISADLPQAGQLAPGDSVRFELCTRAEAMSALIAREGRLLAAR